MRRNFHSTIDGRRVSAAVYAVMLFATKTITAEEAAMIPGGNKLVKIMGKFIK